MTKSWSTQVFRMILRNYRVRSSVLRKLFWNMKKLNWNLQNQLVFPTLGTYRMWVDTIIKKIWTSLVYHWNQKCMKVLHLVHISFLRTFQIPVIKVRFLIKGQPLMCKKLIFPAISNTLWKSKVVMHHKCILITKDPTTRSSTMTFVKRTKKSDIPKARKMVTMNTPLHFPMMRVSLQRWTEDSQMQQWKFTKTL